MSTNTSPIIPGENPQLDAETMQPTLIGISVAFVALSTIVVLLRLYTRCCIIGSPRAVGADDVTIGIAQVLSIGVSVGTVLRMSLESLGTRRLFLPVA